MKKIISLVLVLVLALTAIGGTLAYFTDTDTATNTFTVGNVEIKLNEEFPENELHPGEENALVKKVTVENTGSEDAYMWIELWIPAALDAKTPIDNSLHFNPFDTYTDGTNEYVMRGSEAKALGYTLKYETVETSLGQKDIGGVMYNGYREHIKGDSAKAKGESTAALLARVFMDKGITQCTDEACTKDNCLVLLSGEHYNGKWEIIVNAFGIQADGIDGIEAAIAAYNAQ